MKKVNKVLIYEKIFLNGILIFSILLLSSTLYNITLNESIDNSFTFEPHIVQSGETIWNLATKTNLQTDTRIVVDKIMEYNLLGDATIRPGEVIYIPRASTPLNPEFASINN